MNHIILRVCCFFFSFLSHNGIVEYQIDIEDKARRQNIEGGADEVAVVGKDIVRSMEVLIFWAILDPLPVLF